MIFELILKKLINKIKYLKYYVVDFNYDYKDKNNKIIIRNQKVYIFGI